MSRLRGDQQGFTVMELVVSAVIMSILLVGIGTFLVNSLVGNAVRGARADMLREAQLSLDTISKDARLSAGVLETNVIEDENSPDAATNFGLGWVSGENVLVFANSAEDSSGNILFEDDLHYVTLKNNLVYFVQDGTLYKRILAADDANNRATTTCPIDLADEDCQADRLMANNVTNFSVNYYDGNNNEVDPENARSVEITIDMLATKFGREVDATYTTRMVFRNE